MKIKIVSTRSGLMEEKINEFISNNKDKEIIDIHFTQNGAWVNAFIVFKERSLQRLTDEEVKILKALVFGGLTKKEISGKFSHSVLYTLEKLKDYGIVDFDNETNAYVCEWAKPKFIFEYMLNKEQQDIVMLLKKEGELTQIEITNKTRIPRTTVSRRLEELERMDAVKRSLEGASKNVKLAEWFQNNF